MSYEQIKENIAKAVIKIPKEHYYASAKNIIKGTYDRAPKPEQKKKIYNTKENL